VVAAIFGTVDQILLAKECIHGEAIRLHLHTEENSHQGCRVFFGSVCIFDCSAWVPMRHPRAAQPVSEIDLFGRSFNLLWEFV
jgi:hypothetical protein